MYTRSKNSTLRSNSLALLLAVAIFCASALAHAQQRIAGADKRQIEVPVSAKEHNDISIAGGVVSKIRVVKGKIDYKRDSNGVLSFVMANDEPQTVSVTIIDEDANRFNLMLVPKPIPQQDIILLPTAAGFAATNNPVAGNTALQPTTSYQRRVKQFWVNVNDQTNGVPPAGAALSREVVNETIPLWKEASLQYVSRFIDGDLVAEHYELTNVSKDMLTVLEPELMRPNVVAIYLKDHTLSPGKSTKLIVFRGRNGND